MGTTLAGLHSRDLHCTVARTIQGVESASILSDILGKQNFHGEETIIQSSIILLVLLSFKIQINFII